jgi:hypothetical protein
VGVIGSFGLSSEIENALGGLVVNVEIEFW